MIPGHGSDKAYLPTICGRRLEQCEGFGLNTAKDRRDNHCPTIDVSFSGGTRLDGEIICDERLAHNPLIRLYRKRTPHLRTKWEVEHILTNSLKLEEYFGKVETNFFHLATFAAVPLRNTPVFKFILNLLEAVDRVLLKLPLLKWQAWQVVFVLSQPNKSLFKND